MAYLEAFRLLTLFMLLAIPLVFLLKRPEHEPETAAASQEVP